MPEDTASSPTYLTFQPGGAIAFPLYSNAVFLDAGQDGLGANHDRCAMRFGEDGIPGMIQPRVNDVIVLVSVSFFPVNAAYGEAGIATMQFPYSEGLSTAQILPNDADIVNGTPGPYLHRYDPYGLFRWRCPATIDGATQTDDAPLVYRTRLSINAVSGWLRATWYYERSGQ